MEVVSVHHADRGGAGFLRLLCVGLLAVFLVGDVAGQSGPASSCVMGFHFDESSSPASDLCESFDASFNGDITTQLSGVSKSSGDWGQGYSFGYDGSGDSLTTSIPSEIGSTDYTISAWVYLADSTDNYGISSYRDTSSGDTSISLMYDPDNNGGSFQCQAKDTDFGLANSQSVSENQWYHVVCAVRDDGSNISIYLNGQFQESVTDYDGMRAPDSHRIGAFADGTLSLDGKVDELREYSEFLNSTEVSNLYNYNSLFSNTPPSFNSVTTNPSSWSLSSSVDVSANVTDGDGNVSSVSASVWENGTKIVDGASLTNTGGSTWSVSDLFTVEESNVFYNLTVTATDDDGATSTEKMSQFIKNEVPQFNITDLENQTYFKYSNEWTVNVQEDGDNVPNEEISCQTFLDGRNASSTFSGTEPYSESGSVSADLGQHTFKASCSDPAGNNRNKTVQYTVKAFEFSSSNSEASVFETESIYYDSSSEVGSMVENVTYQLYWNGTLKDTGSVSGFSDPSNLSRTLGFEVPLVESNGAIFDWFTSAVVEYRGVDGSDKLKVFNSSTQSQSVVHAYNFSSENTDKDRYIEFDNAQYSAVLENSSDKASINAEFDTGETDKTVLELVNSSESSQTFGGSVKLPQIIQDQKTVSFNSTFNVSFRNKTRQINSPSVSRDLFRFDLTDCEGGNPVGLRFNTFEEFNQSNAVSSNMDLAVQVWNEGSPGLKRTFNTSSEDKESHEFCIQPSWADLRVDSKEKLIQYYGGDYNRRSYFLFNESLTNDTTEIPLYMNLDPRTSRISVEAEDDRGNSLSDHIVTFERYFPAKDKFLTVGMTRTGSQGASETFLEVNEIYYQFKIFNSEGELVEEIPSQTIPDSLSLLFTVGDDVNQGYYSFEGRVNHDCRKVNNSMFTCSYDGPESMDKIELKAEEDRLVGLNEVCNVNSTSSKGELVCDGLNISGNRYKYSLTSFFSGNQVAEATGFIGERSNDYASAGLFIYFMMFIVTSFAGLWKPSASIALGMLSTLAAYIVGFLAVSQTALISLLAVGAVLIWRMN